LPVVVIVGVFLLKHYVSRKLDKATDGIVGSAREMVAKNKALFTEEYEVRGATEADWEKLDRDWYEAKTAEMEALGFRRVGGVGDIVSVTVEKATGMTTVIRQMVSGDGTTAGGIYHVPLAKLPSFMEGKRLLITEFESEFGDGTFLITGNTKESNLATSPPEVHNTKFSLDTPVAELLAAHEKEKANLLAAKGGQCVRIATAQDLEELHRRQQVVRAKFRKGIGYLDPEEVKRVALAGKKGEDEGFVDVITRSADKARKEEMGEE